jgi:hypothetical protein
MGQQTTIRLGSKYARSRAADAVMKAPDGYVCVLREETRNDRQNRAMWGYIKQLREALPDTLGQYSPEHVKLQFLDALGAEMIFLPKLDGGGLFPVGHRSSTLTVEQFSALLEIIAAYAAKHGVELTD